MPRPLDHRSQGTSVFPQSAMTNRECRAESVSIYASLASPPRSIANATAIREKWSMCAKLNSDEMSIRLPRSASAPRTAQEV
jgi:hypothetical protein